LCGFINTYGHQVIPPFFDEARPFSEGLAAVKLGGKWGYISARGACVITPQFDCGNSSMAGPFRQGLARVARDGKWGYINPTGEFVIPPQFDVALEFSEGLAEVGIGNRRGFVNTFGEVIVPISYR
jgi:hypothetical protein